jgi:hypothetical protein
MKNADRRRYMKYYTVLFCIVCAIALPLLGYTADPGNIYLRFLEGDVQVKTEDAKEWLPASINMPLTDSDQIWVPDNGRAEMFLRNGTIVRLDRNTFLEMPAPGDKQTRFYMGAGRVYGNVIVEKGNAVILETPAASFLAHANSVFRIDVAENEDSTASVFQGELYADRGTGQMKIGAGERMVLKKDAQHPVLAKLLPADEWEQWNKQRDREFTKPGSGNATAYLPDELKPYSYDLNKNGQWVYEQEYGYVWTPTVIVVQNWAPYRIGRWAWMRGDYVWISYEPWGWVPYHYGRWAFIGKRGWCWVPPRRGFAYWGPGYVGWVHTPTYVSWVPLAPREVYYGRGHYGPYSVNIKNVTVQNITANRPAYKNIHVDKAVTTMHRDTFVTGRQVQLTAKENLFLKERRIMGAPEIRPEKATLMPVIKDIPKGKQPPARVAGLAVPSAAANQIRRMDGKKTDVPQRTYNVPAGTRQENPVTGNQAIQKISQPPTRLPKTSPQQGTPKGSAAPPMTGQLVSAPSARTESQKIITDNKTSPQQRVPAATKQAQPTVPARFADVSARRTGMEKNTYRTQAPSVISQRPQQTPTSAVVPQRKQSPAVTSQVLPATRSPSVTPQAQQPARFPSVTPQTQPPAKPMPVAPQVQPPPKPPSVAPQAQSLKREDMQMSGALREISTRGTAPRAERTGGR